MTDTSLRALVLHNKEGVGTVINRFKLLAPVVMGLLLGVLFFESCAKPKKKLSKEDSSAASALAGGTDACTAPSDAAINSAMGSVPGVQLGIADLAITGSAVSVGPHSFSSSTPASVISIDYAQLGNGGKNDVSPTFVMWKACTLDGINCANNGNYTASYNFNIDNIPDLPVGILQVSVKLCVNSLQFVVQADQSKAVNSCSSSSPCYCGAVYQTSYTNGEDSSLASPEFQSVSAAYAQDQKLLFDLANQYVAAANDYIGKCKDADAGTPIFQYAQNIAAYSPAELASYVDVYGDYLAEVMANSKSSGLKLADDGSTCSVGDQTVSNDTGAQGVQDVGDVSSMLSGNDNGSPTADNSGNSNSENHSNENNNSNSPTSSDTTDTTAASASSPSSAKGALLGVGIAAIVIGVAMTVAFGAKYLDNEFNDKKGAAWARKQTRKITWIENTFLSKQARTQHLLESVMDNPEDYKRAYAELDAAVDEKVKVDEEIKRKKIEERKAAQTEQDRIVEKQKALIEQGAQSAQIQDQMVITTQAIQAAAQNPLRAPLDTQLEDDKAYKKAKAKEADTQKIFDAATDRSTKAESEYNTARGTMPEEEIKKAAQKGKDLEKQKADLDRAIKKQEAPLFGKKDEKKKIEDLTKRREDVTNQIQEHKRSLASKGVNDMDKLIAAKEERDVAKRKLDNANAAHTNAKERSVLAEKDFRNRKTAAAIKTFSEVLGTSKNVGSINQEIEKLAEQAAQKEAAVAEADPERPPNQDINNKVKYLEQLPEIGEDGKAYDRVTKRELTTAEARNRIQKLKNMPGNIVEEKVAVGKKKPFFTAGKGLVGGIATAVIGIGAVVAGAMQLASCGDFAATARSMESKLHSQSKSVQDDLNAIMLLQHAQSSSTPTSNAPEQ